MSDKVCNQETISLYHRSFVPDHKTIGDETTQPILTAGRKWAPGQSPEW